MSVMKKFSLLCSALFVSYTTNAFNFDNRVVDDDDCICPVNTSAADLRKTYTLGIRASQGVQANIHSQHNWAFYPYGQYSNKGDGQVRWINENWEVPGLGFECTENDSRSCYKVMVRASVLAGRDGMSLNNKGLIQLTGASNATLEPWINGANIGLSGRFLIKYAEVTGLPGNYTAIFYTHSLNRKEIVQSSANGFTYRGEDAQGLSEETLNDF